MLTAEVKSIYSGLAMVEAKCIHVDKAQAKEIRAGQAKDHWNTILTLHRDLIQEHHDFFCASQHPSASLALQRLAKKHNVPARLWKHGIFSLLELLKDGLPLPDSGDYMISNFAYQMIRLWYETEPESEVWIECLGDLNRFRMAIEEDAESYEIWAIVAHDWYSKAASRSPTVGRSFHHLAILSKTDPLRQLYLFCGSLTCVESFSSARESIITLFNASEYPATLIHTFSSSQHAF